MVDWKRCREPLDPQAKCAFGRMGKPPVASMVDNEHSHYTLQQNLYKEILRSEYNIDVKSMTLVRCHPEAVAYQNIDVPVVPKEVLQLMLRSTASDFDEEAFALIRDESDQNCVANRAVLDPPAILPAALDMIEPLPDYGFMVGYESLSEGSKMWLPCQKVVALIRSIKRGVTSLASDGAFKITTSGVEDLLSLESASQVSRRKTYTLLAMCTMDNLVQYRLDPSCNKTQAAIVILTAKTPEAFIVESVQLLTPDEVGAMREWLQRLQLFSMRVYATRCKRAVEWNKDCSSSASERCKRMRCSVTPVS